MRLKTQITRVVNILGKLPRAFFLLLGFHIHSSGLECAMPLLEKSSGRQYSSYQIHNMAVQGCAGSNDFRPQTMI